MLNSLNVTVLGSGSWGTALACLLRKNGHFVSLWGAFPESIEAIQKSGMNQKYLPGIAIDPKIRLAFRLDELVPGADVLVMAIPTQYIRQVFQVMQDEVKVAKPIFVNVAKGLELGTTLRISQIVRDFYPDARYVTLSGPSHAEEVSRGIPTSVVAASEDETIARCVQKVFHNECFRVYTNRDVVGVELGGALKNVIAIACGISDGLGFGDNSKAALMTRGLSEMMRLGHAMQADPLTMAGLAGMGDLIGTCTSQHSRNRRVGQKIGEGQRLESVIQNMTMVAEGIQTTRAVVALAKKREIEMPIAEKVYEILFHRKDARKAVTELMSRDVREE